MKNGGMVYNKIKDTEKCLFLPFVMLSNKSIKGEEEQ